MKVLLFFVVLFALASAVRKCFVFPIPHAGGTAQSLDCTSNPEHDEQKSGCFYRRFADDSYIKAGFVEGGCGVTICHDGKDNCRLLNESEISFNSTSTFCCCYSEGCNDLKRAESVVGGTDHWIYKNI